MSFDSPHPTDSTDKQFVISNKRLTSIFIRLGIVCGVLLLNGFLFSKLSSMKERPKQADTVGHSLRVTSQILMQEKMRLRFKEFGTARPIRTVDVSAEVGGRIIFIDPIVNVGGLVKKGQLLAKIDPVDYELALSQAQAESMRISSDIARLEVLMTEDKRRVISAQKNYDLAQKNYDRIVDLNKRNAISDTERDKVEQDLLQKDENLVVLNAQIKSFPLQIDSLRASLQSAESAVEKAKIDRNRCAVVAPFDGRIASEAIENGQYYDRGRALYSLADDSSLEINVPIISSDALKLGLKPASSEKARYWIDGIESVQATIRWVEADKNATVPGQAVRIDRVDAETRSMVLVVKPDLTEASETLLTAGMFCEVILIGGEEIEAIKVPRSAIQFESRIFTVDTDLTVRSFIPDIYYRTDNWVYVRDQNLSSQRVVTSKLPFGLVDGMKVELVDQPAGE